MKFTIWAAATAAVLLPAHTFAGTVPTLSGKYATSYNEICQQNNPNIPVQGTGATYTEAVVADFNATAGTVTLKGSEIYGPLVGGYVALTQSPLSESTTFSNTATTVTIGTTTYNVVYGPVKKGVAQSAVLTGIDSAGCAASGVAIRQ